MHKSHKPIPDNTNPNVFRCPVCGGTESKPNNLYPNNRYCAECGIRMKSFDFSAMKDLFSAMSTLRLSREYLTTGWDLRTIYTENIQINAMIEAEKHGIEISRSLPSQEPMEAVLLRMISNALNAYDRFRGANHLVRN
ncbi:MAG: hypothetical protein CSA22_01975 [Deltaproteobacteria bacterium]|nr:MAG: hypothetical protein CSA22_01975 [Deltaproteobacteria bacterium]